MQIKSIVYESLTAQQRVIAVIEAFARKDMAEVDRLIDSCPKKTYRLNDWALSRGLHKLMHLTLNVELMLDRKAMVVMLALMAEQDELIDPLLQSISDTQAAWNEALGTIGISPETVQKAAGTEPLFLELMVELMPDPDPENVTKLVADFKGCLD